MTINDIIHTLEQFAPPVFQESYDNAGLIVGDKNQSASGVLLCLDTTEDIIDEAVAKNCNLVIAHHPVVFSGLKKITGKTYIERTIIKAIKHNISIYAAHTNLDNVYYGVNYKISEKLGIENPKILQPKTGLLSKIAVFTPVSHVEHVRTAMFSAGAGVIGNYDECSFNSEGEGTFKANDKASPYVGKKGERHFEKEVKTEVIVPNYLIQQVITALIEAHPYEEPAYDVFPLKNDWNQIGSGMYGNLSEPISVYDFFDKLKTTFKTKIIRHTSIHKQKIETVAWCGGSGSFLLNDAKRVKADIFITSDFKYHQFFDAENQIIIADIGHFESEQFTIELFYELLTKKFSNFAIHLTDNNTNPINYY